MLPLVIPGIIVASSMLVLFINLGLQPSLTAIIVGHVFLALPFAVSILKSSFDQFDQSLEEASYDLGETVLGTFRRVTLPVVAPGIVSSLLVTFTVSFDEFVLAFFLAGNQPTLPVYIWSQIRFPAKLPNVLALGSLLLVALGDAAGGRRIFPPQGKPHDPWTIGDGHDDREPHHRPQQRGKEVRQFRRVDRFQSGLCRGRVLFAARTVRLRQDPPCCE